jgi:hypothetical protein
MVGCKFMDFFIVGCNFMNFFWLVETLNDPQASSSTKMVFLVACEFMNYFSIFCFISMLYCCVQDY